MKFLGFEFGAKTETIARLEGQVEELRNENVRLEGLLDGFDGVFGPDANVPKSDHPGLYRAIGMSAQAARDFNESKRERILRMSHEVYALRGTGTNIIETIIDFVVGDEMIPKADDEDNTKLQDLLDEIWEDPRTKLDLNHEDKIRTGLLEGEYHLVVNVFPTDGHCMFGFLPVEQVVRVEKNKYQQDVFLITKRPNSTEEDRWFCLTAWDKETIKIDRLGPNQYTVTDTAQDAANPAPQRVRGLVYPFFNNRPDGGFRGRPELTASLDYIDIRDELLWSSVEREKMLRMFILDITDPSVVSPEDGKKKAKTWGLHKAPTGPVVLWHNERMKVALQSPDNGGQPAQMLTDRMQEDIYGGHGMPISFSGKETAIRKGSNDLIPLRRLRRKQRKWVAWFVGLLTILLYFREQYGSVSLPKDLKFTMSHMEVGGKDKQRGSALVKDLAVAAGSLRDVLKREAIHEVITQALDEGGFRISHDNLGLPEESEDLMSRLGEMERMVNQRLGQERGGVMRGGSRGEEPGSTEEPRGVRNVDAR